MSGEELRPKEHVAAPTLAIPECMAIVPPEDSTQAVQSYSQKTEARTYWHLRGPLNGSAEPTAEFIAASATGYATQSSHRHLNYFLCQVLILEIFLRLHFKQS